jgi:hypothetical protein
MTYLLGGPLKDVDLSKTKYGNPPVYSKEIHLPDHKYPWIFHHYKLEKKTSKDRYFTYVTSYEIPQ